MSFVFEYEREILGLMLGWVLKAEGEIELKRKHSTKHDFLMSRLK
jgi:hypothetical protein